MVGSFGYVSAAVHAIRVNEFNSYLHLFGYFAINTNGILINLIKISTKHRPEMIVCGIALLTSLLVANAYGGGLSSIMTVPQYDDFITK